MKNVNQMLAAVLIIIGQQTAKAQLNNHHKSYIDIGLTGGVQNRTSPMAGVYGSFGTFFRVGGKPSSLDVRVKEVYISNPDQQGTLITLTYRMSIVKGLFAGIGGAHGHQVPIGEFMTHTGASVGGTSTHIMHSSGLNAEIGYHFSSFIKDKYVGIYPVVQLAYTHLFMTGHSMPNLTFSAGFKLGFKKWS